MKPFYTKNRTIGLLGGSFNPAHGGHLHITLYALKTLHLDEVWWLVSPQNPLKIKDSLAPYETRLASARAVAQCHPRIRVLDTEKSWKTRYSYQTIERVQARNPGAHFVWLMGADNLQSFHRWRRWHKILHMIPVVVFDRAPYSHTAMRSKAYVKMQKFLLKNTHVNALGTAPGLHFVHLRRDHTSATAMRKKLGKGAFLVHNKDK